MSLPKIVCLILLLSGIISLTANAGLVGYWSFDEGAFSDEAIAVEDAMDPLPVKPGRKLTTTWGAIKTQR